MSVVLGIDLGTQSAKCVVLGSDGTLHAVGQAGYDVQHPAPDRAEQDPAAWWAAIVAAVRAALDEAEIAPDAVAGIGLSGQMHGAVLLGADLEPLHPAIIWMDRRSAALAPQVQARLAPDAVVRHAANRLSPGFAGASLAWFSAHDPALLEQVHVVLQPKDYIALRLTGTPGSEPSDASATWLYDVAARQWSEPLAAACDVDRAILPAIRESAAPAGELGDPAAQALGLRPGIPVVAGAADQAALLLGAGVIEPGLGAITLGTGGQMALVSSTPLVDPQLRLNTFCHALPHRWYTMGAILNGGMALRWWRSLLDGAQPYDDLLAAAAQIPAGAEGVTFLPYLAGERTPHMNPDASGAFTGLALRHTQAHLTRAVLEGVAYAFRDCLETLRTLGPVPDRFVIGGGGAQGALWRQIVAGALGVTVQPLQGREHTATGAAMLAGRGVGLFDGPAAAVAQVVRTGAAESPVAADRAAYEAGYDHFRALYPALNPPPTTS